MGVPVEEALGDVVMKSRNLVIHMECAGKSLWLGSLGEVCTIQSMDKLVDCITNP